MKRTLHATALAATTLVLAVLPGVALAGNPKGAVQDAKQLRVLVNDSPSAQLFSDAARLVQQMSSSREALLQQKAKLGDIVRTADPALSKALRKLGAWKPTSAFGKGMRGYALWIVGVEAQAVSGAAKALRGYEKLMPAAQERTLQAAVEAFVGKLKAIIKGNNAKLGAARIGIPDDEIKAISALSASG
jgi:hypothetical protein